MGDFYNHYILSEGELYFPLDMESNTLIFVFLQLSETKPAEQLKTKVFVFKYFHAKFVSS